MNEYVPRTNARGWRGSRRPGIDHSKEGFGCVVSWFVEKVIVARDIQRSVSWCDRVRGGRGEESREMERK
jgi:hypothetical protein